MKMAFNVFPLVQFFTNSVEFEISPSSLKHIGNISFSILILTSCRALKATSSKNNKFDGNHGNELTLQ